MLMILERSENADVSTNTCLEGCRGLKPWIHSPVLSFSLMLATGPGFFSEDPNGLQGAGVPIPTLYCSFRVRILT